MTDSQKILRERYVFPLKTEPGTLTVVVHDSNDELFTVIDPSAPRDVQLAAASLICDLLNREIAD